MTSIFISHSHQDLPWWVKDHPDTRTFIKELEDTLRDVTPVQTALISRFKAAVDLTRDDLGDIDPRQEVRAHLIAAWRALNDLSDEEWDAVAGDLADEISALRSVCNHEDPSVDH